MYGLPKEYSTHPYKTSGTMDIVELHSKTNRTTFVISPGVDVMQD